MQLTCEPEKLIWLNLINFQLNITSYGNGVQLACEPKKFIKLDIINLLFDVIS